jgi:hypothetical protein
MHVTEPGPALRHLGQSFPFQQTISTQATSYLCAVCHATQRSAPGANTRAPTLPPHVITDWEYGGIEYGGLPVPPPCILRCTPTVFVVDACDAIAHGLQIQDDAQCRINAAHLVEAEEPDALTEPARVDRCGLFGKYPGVYATDFDLRPKACGTS